MVPTEAVLVVTGFIPIHPLTDEINRVNLLGSEGVRREKVRERILTQRKRKWGLIRKSELDKADDSRVGLVGRGEVW